MCTGKVIGWGDLVRALGYDIHYLSQSLVRELLDRFWDKTSENKSTQKEKTNRKGRAPFLLILPLPPFFLPPPILILRGRRHLWPHPRWREISS